MKKFVLAAIAAACTGAAFADADFTVTPKTADTYASERIVAGATLDAGTLSHVIGFGVSTGQDRYLRYELSNGTFDVAVVAGDLVIGGAGADVAVVSGGNVGQSFVIFQITALGDLGQATPVGFDATGVEVVSKATNVGVTVSLYDFPANAQAGGATGRLYTDSGTLIGIASGLDFSTTPFTTTASVATEYKEFKATASLAPVDGFFDVATAKIGELDHQVVAGTLDENGAALTMNQLTALGTSVTVTGDLSFATGVYASADDCATSAAAFTINVAKTAATLVVDTNSYTDLSICMNVNGTAAIPVTSYEIAADIVAAVGADTADQGPKVLGDFVRDGTILKHAFAEGAMAGTGFSAAAHLTNLSSGPAPYTVRCLLNSGSVAGTPGTVPANTAVRAGLTSGMGCPANGTLRGLEITLAVPEGRVIGAIVRQNVSTGTASFDTMIGSK